jgi:hypothetical protein
MELRHNGAHVNSFNKRQPATLICPDDTYARILSDSPDERVETFCNEWLGIAPATVTVDVTPTV